MLANSRPQDTRPRLTWQRCECRQWTQVWSSTDGMWCSSGSATKSTADLWSGSDSSRISPFQTALLKEKKTKQNRTAVTFSKFQDEWAKNCKQLQNVRVQLFKMTQKKRYEDRDTYTAYDTELLAPNHPHGSNHSLKFQEPQRVSSRWLGRLWEGRVRR